MPRASEIMEAAKEAVGPHKALGPLRRLGIDEAYVYREVTVLALEYAGIEKLVPLVEGSEEGLGELIEILLIPNPLLKYKEWSGKKYEEIALKVGLSRQTLQLYATGEVNPSDERRETFRKKLGIEPGEWPLPVGKPGRRVKDAA